MQRDRGHEALPLLLAVLAEPLRLRYGTGHSDADLAFRRHSYALRSRYADQLDVLFQHFCNDQVLLLRSEDLQSSPATVVTQVCAFIGTTQTPAGNTFPPIFKGNYRPPKAWSPGMLALRWRLRCETRVLATRPGVQL